MTNEEKIKGLENRIFLIEVGTDYLTNKDWELIDKLKKEIEELKNESENNR